MAREFHSASPDDTRRFGVEVAKRLSAGDVVTIQGDLGVGKSVLVRGIAAALGVTERITSPTYTIIAEYDGTLPVYHFDLYRLESDVDFELLGAEEILEGSGVSLVEWPERTPELVEQARLHVQITIGEDELRTLRYRWNDDDTGL